MTNFSLRKVNHNSSQSLFTQLEEIIRDGIEQGIWQPGMAIPSERELSQIHGLSRMTVRRALDRLVTAGVLYRVEGKGTFVNQPKFQFHALSLAGLREQTLQLGYSPSTNLLSVERVLVNSKYAGILQIDVDSPVFLIERAIYGNEIPLAILRSYIPESICPDLDTKDLANQSLYSILRQEYGIFTHRATETLETTLATPWESAILQVSTGSPMFLLRITMFDHLDQPIEYVKVIFRGDRIQLSLDL